MIFTVKNRIITLKQPSDLIGDNADYVARFEFDEEWNNVTKTARFMQSGRMAERLLDENNACKIPLEILKEGFLQVGVYSSEMTTTTCSIFIKRSIKQHDGVTIPPEQNIYEQLLQRLDSLENVEINPEDIENAVSNYFQENPIQSLTQEEVENIVNNIIAELDIKDGQDGENGKSIEYNWNGTQLGIRQEGELEYTYVNLKGEKGDKGQDGANAKTFVDVDYVGYEWIQDTQNSSWYMHDTYKINYSDDTSTTFDLINHEGTTIYSDSLLWSPYNIDTSNRVIEVNSNEIIHLGQLASNDALNITFNTPDESIELGPYRLMMYHLTFVAGSTNHTITLSTSTNDVLTVKGISEFEIGKKYEISMFENIVIVG